MSRFIQSVPISRERSRQNADRNRLLIARTNELLATIRRRQLWTSCSPAATMIERAAELVWKHAQTDRISSMGPRMGQSPSAQEAELEVRMMWQGLAVRRIHDFFELIDSRVLPSARSISGGAEYVTLGSNEHVFRAVDSLIMYLMERFFGVSVLRRWDEMGLPWLPIALSGSEYGITPATGVARVPLLDLYRCRFWVLLAHEVAHLSFPDRWKRDSFYVFWPDSQGERVSKSPAWEECFRELTLVFEKQHAEARRELQLGKCPEWNTVNVVPRDDYLARQLEEFMCDAFAAHIFGLSYLLALMAFAGIHETGTQGGCGVLLNHSHPPLLVRYNVLADALGRRGWQEELRSSGVAAVLEREQEKVSSEVDVYLDLMRNSELQHLMDSLCTLSIAGQPAGPRPPNTGEIMAESQASMSIPDLFSRVWQCRMEINQDDFGVRGAGLFGAVVVLLNQRLDDLWARVHRENRHG